MHKGSNLSFSKLKIIGIDGDDGHLDKVRLKHDPIRIAQREYLVSRKKKLQKAGRKSREEIIEEEEEKETRIIREEGKRGTYAVGKSLQVGSIS